MRAWIVTRGAALWLAVWGAACGGADSTDEGARSGVDSAAGADGAAGGGEPAEPAAPVPAREGQERELTEVNEFLSYDAADSLVDLKLWAGYRGVNNAWSFDGYYAGNATIVVPLGWKVVATFQNLDANVVHSAAIIEADDTVPPSGGEATIAFTGASTGNLTGGYSSRGAPRTFRFRADRAGRFRVYCGIPGHGPGGMWIWFEVAATAATPEFRTG